MSNSTNVNDRPQRPRATDAPFRASMWEGTHDARFSMYERTADDWTKRKAVFEMQQATTKALE